MENIFNYFKQNIVYNPEETTEEYKNCIRHFYKSNNQFNSSFSNEININELLPTKKFDTLEMFYKWISHITKKLFPTIKDIMTYYLSKIDNDMYKAYEYSLINILYHNVSIHNINIGFMFNRNLFIGDSIVKNNINIRNFEIEYEQNRNEAKYGWNRTGNDIFDLTSNFDKSEELNRRCEYLSFYLGYDAYKNPHDKNLYLLLKLLKIKLNFTKVEINKNDIITFEKFEYKLRCWIDLKPFTWLKMEHIPEVFKKYAHIRQCKINNINTDLVLSTEEISELVKLKVKNIIDKNYLNNNSNNNIIPHEYYYDENETIFTKIDSFDIFQTLMICDEKFKYPFLNKIILHYYTKRNKLTILRYKNDDYLDPIQDNLYYYKCLNLIVNNEKRNFLIVNTIKQILNIQNRTCLIFGECRRQLNSISDLLQSKLNININEIISNNENIKNDTKFILLKNNKIFNYELLLKYNFDILIIITPMIISFNKILDTIKNIFNKEVYYVYDDYGITKNNLTELILPETFSKELSYLGN